MAGLVMHSYPSNSRAWKAIIAGRYNGVEISYPSTFKMGVDNKTPEFLAMNPLGQVPTLQTPEGGVWESNAIARYVARLGKAVVYGKTTFEAAQIDQWIDFAANNIDLASAAWLYPIMGHIPNDHIAQLATTKAKETLKKVMRVLNNHLVHHTFLVGERVSLADIVVCMGLLPLYQNVFDHAYRHEFHSVNRWFQTCVHQPHFHAVVGDVKLCETAKVAAAPAAAPAAAAHEAGHGKGGKKGEKGADQGHHEHGHAHEGGKKGEKGGEHGHAHEAGHEHGHAHEGGKKGGKGAAKPKEEKPKAEKPKAEEKHEEHAGGDEEDEEKEAKPKEKNPLDLLPPSKFSMDEWKRMYSNNDTKTVAMPWFWQNYDPEGFSLWKVDYKHNSELTKVWLTSNLLNGWFQRLEKLHKYAFGCVLIHGKEEPLSLSVSGVWLFRGAEIPKDMQECDDSLLYTWTKLNHADTAHKTVVNEYFAWEGDFGGLGKPEQGKAYK